MSCGHVQSCGLPRADPSSCKVDVAGEPLGGIFVRSNLAYSWRRCRLGCWACFGGLRVSSKQLTCVCKPTQWDFPGAPRLIDRRLVRTARRSVRRVENKSGGSWVWGMVMWSKGTSVCLGSLRQKKWSPSQIPCLTHPNVNVQTY